MSESRAYELQEWPKQVYKYQFHPQEAAFHLSRAFSLFAKEAEQLRNAYSKLQEKWLGVNEELTKNITELNRLTTYFNHIVKNISQGILFIQLDSTLQFINESAQKYLQIKADEIVGKKIDTAFSSDALGFSIREALVFGLAPKIAYKTYKEKTLEISTLFVYEGPKSQHGLIVMVKDISDVEQLQLTIGRQERLSKLGELVATVAHEIRNPLGGIRGYASLLFRDLQNTPHLQEMAHFVIEGTKNLETLVTSVLEYTRPIQMQIRPIELGHFFRQLIKFVKIDPAFPDHVQMQLHIPFASLMVFIDPEALKSALLNLIFNAIQAMPSGGLVRISLLQRETSCQIEIADTGTGMDEEEVKRLFSPFYTTKQKGNGLGLARAQKIVQAHLGSIDVRSQLGRGSTFTLTLPLKR
jgi:signal transduction histidine kinase